MLKSFFISMVLAGVIYSQNFDGSIRIIVDEPNGSLINRYNFTLSNGVITKKIFENIKTDSISSEVYDTYKNRYSQQEDILSKIEIHNSNVLAKYGIDKLVLGDDYIIDPTGNFIFLNDLIENGKPIISLRNNQEYPIPNVSQIDYKLINDGLWNPRGTLLTILGDDKNREKSSPYPNSLTIFNVESLRIEGNIFVSKREIMHYDWSPDSKYIAVLSKESHMDNKIWNLILALLSFPVIHNNLYLEIYDSTGKKMAEYKIVEDIQMNICYMFWFR